MEQTFAVIVSTPAVDGVVAGALIGRAAEGRAEALVFDSQKLAEFFEPSVQARLPRGYDLILCGLGVTHVDWDGQLVRPRLMDALRGFTGPIRWFGSGFWEPEDVRAVGHLIGEGNLALAGPQGGVAGLVRDTRFGAEDEYEDSLARFASGRLAPEEQDRWGAGLWKVLTALKRDHYDLAGAVGALMENRLESLIDTYGDMAEEMERENRSLAQTAAEEPVRMGEMKLVFVSVPPAKHPFWQEISAYARQASGAQLSLCHLQGKPVVLLGRASDARANLRAWARYVTDSLPAATAVGAQEGVVALVIAGLPGNPAMKDEVLSLMAAGVHLLRS